MMTLNEAEEVLNRYSGGMLLTGSHDAPNGECKMCVRELRHIMVNWPRTKIGRLSHRKKALQIAADGWTDTPECTTTNRVCISFNDARWSSDRSRTAHCLPLVLLSESNAVDGWEDIWFRETIRVIVPIALRAAAVGCSGHHEDNLLAAANKCESDPVKANAARAANAADAANAARAAANAAAYVADADAVLAIAVNLFIDCHSGVIRDSNG